MIEIKLSQGAFSFGECAQYEHVDLKLKLKNQQAEPLDFAFSTVANFTTQPPSGVLAGEGEQSRCHRGRQRSPGAAGRSEEPEATGGHRQHRDQAHRAGGLAGPGSGRRCGRRHFEDSESRPPITFRARTR